MKLILELEGKKIYRVESNSKENKELVTFEFYDKNSNLLGSNLCHRNNITDIVVSKDAKVLGEHVFENFPNLKNVSGMENIETICDYAFYNCSKLSEVIMPNTVTSLGDYAFCNCYGLKLTLSSNILYIGKFALAGISREVTEDEQRIERKICNLSINSNPALAPHIFESKEAITIFTHNILDLNALFGQDYEYSRNLTVIFLDDYNTRIAEIGIEKKCFKIKINYNNYNDFCKKITSPNFLNSVKTIIYDSLNKKNLVVELHGPQLNILERLAFGLNFAPGFKLEYCGCNQSYDNEVPVPENPYKLPNDLEDICQHFPMLQSYISSIDLTNKNLLDDTRKKLNDIKPYIDLYRAIVTTIFFLNGKLNSKKFTTMVVGKVSEDTITKIYCIHDNKYAKAKLFINSLNFYLEDDKVQLEKKIEEFLLSESYNYDFLKGTKNIFKGTINEFYNYLCHIERTEQIKDKNIKNILMEEFYSDKTLKIIRGTSERKFAKLLEYFTYIPPRDFQRYDWYLDKTYVAKYPKVDRKIGINYMAQTAIALKILDGAYYDNEYPNSRIINLASAIKLSGFKYYIDKAKEIINSELDYSMLWADNILYVYPTFYDKMEREIINRLEDVLEKINRNQKVTRGSYAHILKK